MSDIVERLRAWDRCFPGNMSVERLVDDATDEIERLRAEVAALRATAAQYEELRAVIDGGHESFTHADALSYVRHYVGMPLPEPPR